MYPHSRHVPGAQLRLVFALLLVIVACRPVVGLPERTAASQEASRTTASATSMRRLTLAPENHPALMPRPSPVLTPTGTAAILPTAMLTMSPTASSLALRAPMNKRGIHLLLDDGRNQWPVEPWPEHMALARRAVGEWGYVTQLVRLDDLNVERWQVFMDLCATFHLTPILRLATTFDDESRWWQAPSIDPDGTYQRVAGDYARFLKALTWPTNEHLVIVHNEPNRGDEWGGRPDPAGYARLLIDVATAVHAADPEAVILNGGLDLFAPHSGSRPAFDGRYYMDAESFLDQMYQAYPDVFTHIDRWASHAYPLGPFVEGPWQQAFTIDLLNDATNPRHIEPPSDIYNRGINGYQWELFKLETYGVRNIAVMITETGWRHAESTDPAATDQHAPLPDASVIARFLDLALHGNNGRYPALPEDGWTPWLHDPAVIAVTPFALNGHPAEWGHTNWLMLDPHGKVLGTYAPFDVFSSSNVQRLGRSD